MKARICSSLTYRNPTRRFLLVLSYLAPFTLKHFSDVWLFLKLFFLPSWLFFLRWNANKKWLSRAQQNIENSFFSFGLSIKRSLGNHHLRYSSLFLLHQVYYSTHDWWNSWVSFLLHLLHRSLHRQNHFIFFALLFFFSFGFILKLESLVSKSSRIIQSKSQTTQILILLRLLLHFTGWLRQRERRRKRFHLFIYCWWCFVVKMMRTSNEEVEVFFLFGEENYSITHNFSTNNHKVVMSMTEKWRRKKDWERKS